MSSPQAQALWIILASSIAVAAAETAEFQMLLCLFRTVTGETHKLQLRRKLSLPCSAFSSAQLFFFSCILKFQVFIFPAYIKLSAKVQVSHG